MEFKEVFAWISANLNAWDVFAILITYLFTQRLKGLVEKNELKRIVAIGVGFIVSAAYCSGFGGWDQFVFYGFLYGAGAIFIYEIGFEKVMVKIGEGLGALVDRTLGKINQ